MIILIVSIQILKRNKRFKAKKILIMKKMIKKKKVKYKMNWKML